MPERLTEPDDFGGTWARFESARRRFLAARAAESARMRREAGRRLSVVEASGRGAEEAQLPEQGPTCARRGT